MASKKTKRAKAPTRPRPTSPLQTYDRALFPEDMVTSIRRKKRPVHKQGE